MSHKGGRLQQHQASVPGWHKVCCRQAWTDGRMQAVTTWLRGHACMLLHTGSPHENCFTMHACCCVQVLTWGYVAVEATILEKTLAITSSLAVSCLSGSPSATARWRNQCLLASYNGNCSR